MSYVHWNTPIEILRPIRDMCGRIQFDPCSNQGSIVDALIEIHLPVSGLDVDWAARVDRGRCAFVNPPYSLEDNVLWSLKWAHEAGRFRDMSAAHLFGLVQASPGTRWFRAYLRTCDAVCFPDSRIKFLRDGKPVAGANFGNALFYAGPDPERFESHLSTIGSVLYR